MLGGGHRRTHADDPEILTTSSIIISRSSSPLPLELGNLRPILGPRPPIPFPARQHASIPQVGHAAQLQRRQGIPNPSARQPGPARGRAGGGPRAREVHRQAADKRNVKTCTGLESVFSMWFWVVRGQCDQCDLGWFLKFFLFNYSLIGNHNRFQLTKGRKYYRR